MSPDFQIQLDSSENSVINDVSFQSSNSEQLLVVDDSQISVNSVDTSSGTPSESKRSAQYYYDYRQVAKKKTST